jgi:hypothetical protein
MRIRSKIAALGAAVGIAALGIGAGGASAGGIIPELGVGLAPVDGAAWLGQTGLADSFGDANQALDVTVGSAGMPRAAVISGLAGQPASALRTLSFATPKLPGGIEPCWDIGYTNPDGSTGNLMINPVTRSDSVTFASEPIEGTDWTQYSFGVHLAPGTTLDSVTVGVDVAADQPSPVTVPIDNLSVAGRTWTFAGDNGMPGPAGA